ncbi:MAG: hypothetical protein WD448_08160 [Woeseia sp.]
MSARPGKTAVNTVGRVQLRQAVLMFAAIAVCAACAKEDGLTADQMIDGMLAAIGPAPSRKAVQSLSTTAEGSGPEGPFAITVTSIPPSTVYVRQQTSNGITEIWSTPERTWGGDAGEKYEPMGRRVRDFVREQEFHLMLLDIRSRFSDFELQAKESIAGAECQRISMRDEAGDEASICVRPEDWLPAELRLMSGGAGGPARIYFDDWREVDGLNLFHSSTLAEESERLFSYDYVDISINTFAYEIRVPPPDLPRVRSE